MKSDGLILLLSFIGITLSAFPISSRPITTNYSPLTGALSFRLEWKPSLNISASSLLEVTMPIEIHNSSQPLTYTITDQYGITIMNQKLSFVAGSNVYYFPLAEMEGMVWYAIQIEVAAGMGEGYGLVGVAVVDGVDRGLVYQNNEAFQYYYFALSAFPAENITVNMLSTPNTKAGAVYPVDISFSSSFLTPSPLTVSLSLTAQNQSMISLPISPSPSFKFTGQCHLLCQSSSCIDQLSCVQHQSQITIDFPDLLDENYTVRVYVINPVFMDSAGIAVVVEQGGVVMAAGGSSSVLLVEEIEVLPAEIYLLWGVPLDIVVNEMQMGIFIGGGWNNIDLGFTLGITSPFGLQLTVHFYLGASSVLLSSISTNLPSFNGSSSPSCSYAQPYLSCSDVDAFTSTALRYYLRVKAYFSLIDDFGGLGSVKIEGREGDLFAELVRNESIPGIVWNNYRDSDGFHNGDKYGIGQTMVVGGQDSGLDNATSTFMDEYFTSGKSFVGIDPTIETQMLVFLLKTNQSQISNGLSNQTYEMKIFFNPHPFQSVGLEGLDLAAYSNLSSTYSPSAPSCLVDSSPSPVTQIYQCQPYHDHVNSLQVDNTITLGSFYGIGRMVCGDGEQVRCATGNCLQSCRVFKGMGSGQQGEGGVFSLRGVTFKQGYQSDISAGEMVLDFVVGFYQGGQLVSASLLNAYTLKNSRLSTLTLSFSNVYLPGNDTNTGQSIPTLLFLSGTLPSPTSQFAAFKINIFLPQSLTVNRYIESNSSLGCSATCSASIREERGEEPMLCLDNWICKQRVEVQGTGRIDVRIPVEVRVEERASVQVAVVDGTTIVQIYRIGGSVVNEPFTRVNSVLIPYQSTPSLWLNSSYWVFNPSDYYYQSIDINSISPFLSSIAINMQGSSLSFGSNPSSTFTSTGLNPFSPFSWAIANTLDSCPPPFSYQYEQSKEIAVLWCPLSLLSTNQIVISYPYFSVYGSGYPFDATFAYAVSDSDGSLLSFRRQNKNKTTYAQCTLTTKTAYNCLQVTAQPITFGLELTQSIALGGGYYDSISVVVRVPGGIALQYLSCEGEEGIGEISLTCNITSQGNGSVTLELKSSSLVEVVELAITIWVRATAPASVTVGLSYYYTVQMHLPQSGVLGGSSPFGLNYTPYSSMPFSCSSLFPLSSIPFSQSLFLSSLSLHSVSLLFPVDLSFVVEFTHSRQYLLPDQTLLLSFTGVTLTASSQCWLWSPSVNFTSQVRTPSTLSLQSSQVVDGFGMKSYTVNCTELTLTNNIVTLSLKWMDNNLTILQQSISPLTSLQYNYSAPAAVTASIPGKLYNTLGYDSQVDISVAMGHAVGDQVEVWVWTGGNHLHRMVVECQEGGVRVYCKEEKYNRVHVVFRGRGAPTIELSIYGIRQKVNCSDYSILVIVNSLHYFIATAPDPFPPSPLSSPPLILLSSALSPSTATLVFTLPPPVSVITSLLQVPDSLLNLQPLNCTSPSGPCSIQRMKSNLYAVAFGSGLQGEGEYSLSLVGLSTRMEYELIDVEKVSFRLFAVQGQNVTMGSVEQFNGGGVWWDQIGQVLQVWEYPPSNASWLFHRVNIGYYSPPVVLSLRNNSNYRQSLEFNLSSLHNYSLSSAVTPLLMEMGQNQMQLYLVATDNSTAWLLDEVYLTPFLVSPSAATEETLYPPPPALQIFIDYSPCLLSFQYSLYELPVGGRSLPLLLNFTNCPPVHPLLLSSSINTTTKLVVDSGLSNSHVQPLQKEVFFVVRQIPTDAAAVGVHALHITVGGINSEMFLAGDVRVKVNSIHYPAPQGLVPTLNNLTSMGVTVRVQCNVPSTIYWLLTKDSSLLGTTAGEIEAKLTASGWGLSREQRDLQEWGETRYGMDYGVSPNQNVDIQITALRGSTSYQFKYYCLDLQGRTSEGQIKPITTPQSQYGLNKVTLSFVQPLAREQAELLACAIAQTLVTPYRTVLTSTGSNCQSPSSVYYSSPSTVYSDWQSPPPSPSLSPSPLSLYNFYIDSLSIPTQQIRRILPSWLSSSLRYKQARLPLYTVMHIETLVNNYQPTIFGSSFEVGVSSLTITVDVGVAEGYLVVGMLNYSADSANRGTSGYLLKQGNYSSLTLFDKMQIKYGSGNLTLLIPELASSHNYSLYYMVTVDDSNLNCRHSQIYYQNISTLDYLIYYLASKPLTGAVAVLMCLLLL